MNNNTHDERKDMQKLQDLLKEYTEKLREICEAKLQYDFRRFLTVAFTGGFTALTMILFAFFILKEGGDTTSLVPPIITIVIVSIATFTIMLGIRRRRNFSFDADQVAMSLQKLIKYGSQHSEHAPKLISEKFEFDLRLAEAEATLRLYYKIYDQKPPIHEDDYNRPLSHGT